MDMGEGVGDCWREETAAVGCAGDSFRVRTGGGSDSCCSGWSVEGAVAVRLGLGEDGKTA